MKDDIIFPVVGTHYEKEMALKFIQENSVLELQRDFDNPIDALAIKVLFNGNAIGYVPNQGFSCRNCLSSVRKDALTCKQCGTGWEDIVEGGLAFRIITGGILEKNYCCFVKSLDLTSKFSPVTARLMYI